MTDAKAATQAVAEWLGNAKPRVAIVLGSGLAAIADRVSQARRIRYSSIPGFPSPGVAGHAGELVAGTLAGVQVLVQQGRFHLYEGHSADIAALPVRVFHSLGVHVVIVTNAAGGIRRTLRPGQLMLIADHINLMWRNPLVGPVAAGEERFPDMSDPYDRELRNVVRAAARDAGVALDEGVYAGLLGPSYETPAEIRMLERLGADAVGMSTVPEVVAARACGMRVVGLSMITNVAAGLSGDPVSHADVLAVGARAADRVATLLEAVLPRLS